MKSKTFLLLFLILFLNLASGLDCLGSFQTDTSVDLIQTCDSCTFVNVSSITYPNGTVNINEAMTKVGTTYNFTLPDSSQTGTIFYSVIGDKDTILTEETLCIELTKTGTILTDSEATVYLILAFGVFLLFALSFYFMIAVPYGNDINQKGAVIKVTKLKYIKLGFILLTWVLFTWFLNILVGLSINFVSLTMYLGFFGFLFQTMNNLALPLGIFIIVLSFFEIIKDSNIMKNIKMFGSSLR